MALEPALNLWLRVFAPFAAGYYLSYLLRNVNAIIAPELTAELGVSAADLGLLTSAYLLAFGAFQLPLGVLLDRYGPRRVEAALLMIAALGCAAFSLGENLPHLAFARGLVGLGVSACLMGSFKAFSLWFAAERQASLNAAVMAAGALGALSATVPLGWALPVLGWRGIFITLSVLAVLAAAGILSTPEKPATGRPQRFGEQIAGVAGIVMSRAFWRFAPQAAVAIGGFMALQGLWAVPWLMRVDGYSREAAAFHLLLSSGGMLMGFLAIATLIVPLRRRGIEPSAILAVGMGVGIALMTLIVLGAGTSHLLWFGLGLVFSVGNLAYALLAEHFPRELSGRVTTALNLASFVGAFGLQWGVGVAVDLLGARGMATADAYRWAFGALTAAQAAAWLWFLAGGRRTGTKA